MLYFLSSLKDYKIKLFLIILVILFLNFFLIPPKNYIALANAIKNFCNNKKKLKKIGKAARKNALENFDVNDVVSHHLHIYKTLEL